MQRAADVEQPLNAPPQRAIAGPEAPVATDDPNVVVVGRCAAPWHKNTARTAPGLCILIGTEFPPERCPDCGARCKVDDGGCALL